MGLIENYVLQYVNSRRRQVDVHGLRNREITAASNNKTENIIIC